MRLSESFFWSFVERLQPHWADISSDNPWVVVSSWVSILQWEKTCLNGTILTHFYFLKGVDFLFFEILFTLYSMREPFFLKSELCQNCQIILALVRGIIERRPFLLLNFLNHGMKPGPLRLFCNLPDDMLQKS